MKKQRYLNRNYMLLTERRGHTWWLTCPLQSGEGKLLSMIWEDAVLTRRKTKKRGGGITQYLITAIMPKWIFAASKSEHHLLTKKTLSILLYIALLVMIWYPHSSFKNSGNADRKISLLGKDTLPNTSSHKDFSLMRI